jgi:hypothetical protein
MTTPNSNSLAVRNFVALPDPTKTPLSAGQLAAVFGGDVDGGLRALVQASLRSDPQNTTDNMQGDPAREKATNG